MNTPINSSADPSLILREVAHFCDFRLTHKLHRVILSTWSILFVSGTASAVVINELRVSDAVNDDVSNFFELSGTPGESLDGLTLVIVNGEVFQNDVGQISILVNLDGHAIPSDGFFLAATTSSFYSGTDLATGIDFFADASSYLLVSNFTGALGLDLDTNNDGILDIMPWNSIVDALSLIDGDGTQDFSYGGGPLVGPVGLFVPAYSYRDPNDSNNWRFPLDGLTNKTLDSPGTENLPVPEANSLLLLGIVSLCFTIVRWTERKP